jgi:predicted DNA binding CopG/RHH family protein
VPDFGERGKESMKRKTKYTDEPMGDLKVVKDFLPPPDQLVLKEDRVKVTISLSKGSVEFFKKEAKKQRTSYQKMIRRIIDAYTSQYQKNV